MGAVERFECKGHDADSHFRCRLGTRQTPVSRVRDPAIERSRPPPSQRTGLTGCDPVDPSDRGEVASSAIDVSTDADLLRKILRMAARRTRSACHRHSEDFPVRRDGRGRGRDRTVVASGPPRQETALAVNQATSSRMRDGTVAFRTSGGRSSKVIRHAIARDRIWPKAPVRQNAFPERTSKSSTAASRRIDSMHTSGHKRPFSNRANLPLEWLHCSGT